MAKMKKPSMARKTTSTPCRNYVYGALDRMSPAEREVVLDQVYRAHAYQNRLVEIERARRDGYRQIRRSLSTRLDTLETEYDRLSNEVKTRYEALSKVKDPGRPGFCLPRARRGESAEAQGIVNEIETLLGARKILSEDIRAERRLVEKEHLNEARTASGDDKTQTLLTYVAEYVNPDDAPEKAAERARVRQEACRLLQGKPDDMDEKAYRAARRALTSTKWCGPNASVRREVGRRATAGTPTTAGERCVYNEGKAHDAWKEARRDSGCFPGVYLRVDSAAEKSFRDSQYEPKFRRYDRTGAVGIQLQNGLSVKDALAGTDPRLKITLPEEQHVRGDHTAAALVASMPDATPEQVVDAARQKGFGKSFSTKAVVQIRESLRKKGVPATSARQAAMVRIRLTRRDVIEVPIVLHRPLPKDGRIQWVYLHVDRIGLRLTYKLRLTIEAESFDDDPQAGHREGTIAVNVGWRVLPKGDVRVATTYDGQEHGQVVLPYKGRQDATFFRKILSASDQHFDDARAAFVKWLPTAPDTREAMRRIFTERPRKLRDRILTPDEATEDTLKRWADARHWESHGKLAGAAIMLRRIFLNDDIVRTLWSQWKAERIRPRPTAQSIRAWHKDARSINLQRKSLNDLFDDFATLDTWFEAHGVSNPHVRVALYMDWWRQKDAHLQNTARSIEKRLTRSRQDLYRNMAAEWAARYEKVIVEKWDKSQTAQTPTPENNLRTKQEEHASAMRQFCGVSVLTDALKQKFRRDFAEVDARDISTVHVVCGGHAETDTARDVQVRCQKCGRQYDQDMNAARHLWDRRERPGDDANPGTARKGGKQEVQTAAE